MTKFKALRSKGNHIRWLVSITIAFTGLLAGSLGAIPRCDSFQTKAAAIEVHSHMRKEMKYNEDDNAQEHDQIYEELRIQGRRIEKNHAEQQESIKDLQKTLWSIYREVKK